MRIPQISVSRGMSTRATSLPRICSNPAVCRFGERPPEGLRCGAEITRYLVQRHREVEVGARPAASAPAPGEIQQEQRKALLQVPTAQRQQRLLIGAHFPACKAHKLAPEAWHDGTELFKPVVRKRANDGPLQRHREGRMLCGAQRIQAQQLPGKIETDGFSFSRRVFYMRFDTSRFDYEDAAKRIAPAVKKLIGLHAMASDGAFEDA